METIRKLETTMAGWYKGMPHLPAEGRKWLAQNIWWITLIGVICGVIALVGVIFLTLFAGAALTLIAGGFGAAMGVVIFLGALASILLGVVCVVLGGMAINPLKAMQKKGWTLLFDTLLIQAVVIIVTHVLSFNLMALLWNLLWVAVGGYFLFEIRESFGASEVKKKTKASQK